MRDGTHPSNRRRKQARELRRRATRSRRIGSRVSEAFGTVLYCLVRISWDVSVTELGAHAADAHPAGKGGSTNPAQE